MKNILKLTQNDKFNLTTDRSVYNKIHKNKEASYPYYRWNRGCNCNSRRFYGGYEHLKNKNKNNNDTYIHIKYPSWKLVSKKKKQWIKKPKAYKITEKKMRYNGYKYLSISF
jgi:hypothetical protein